MSQPETANPTQDVFDWVFARPVDAPDLQHGRLVHVLWRAPEQGDRLVQFYVNGRLNSSSQSPTDRETWLVLDPHLHHEIELLAVSPSCANRPLDESLGGAEPGTSPYASIALLRDYDLPVDATVRVAVDGQIAAEASPLFADDAARGGFGAVFGEGGFGFDASTGPGLGGGELGFGPLGVDGDTLRWRDDTLPAGDHTLCLSLSDAAGQPAALDLETGVSISRLPSPPTSVAMGSDLTLTWT